MEEQQEEPRPEKLRSENLAGNEQELPSAKREEESLHREENQEPRSEKLRSENLAGNEQELPSAKHEEESLHREENQEPRPEKLRSENLAGNEQELPSAKREEESLHREENQERTTETQRSKKQIGNEQELQCTERIKQSKSHDEYKGQPFLALLLVGVLLVPVAYIVLNFQSHKEFEVVEKMLNIFLKNFGKVQKSFPNQEEQMWKRSRIMLQKHVNMTLHSEPSILMFAAAQDAKKTMHCLTSRIAGAYASAFNASVIEIDGSSKKLLNSDVVKLELDNQLSSGFGEGRKSAVVHHFQDLPPPSTLLFYKYCDHENAAFKDVSILITILVDEQKLDPDLSFYVLEETVYDFLVMKFSISGKAGQYNILDTDKFSGLWSRIAHAILPVRPEKEIEENGCKHE